MRPQPSNSKISLLRELLSDILLAFSMSVFAGLVATLVDLVKSRDLTVTNAMVFASGLLIAAVSFIVWDRRKLGSWKKALRKWRFVIFAVPMSGALVWLVSLVV